MLLQTRFGNGAQAFGLRAISLQLAHTAFQLSAIAARCAHEKAGGENMNPFLELVWKAADGRVPNNRAAFVQFLLDYFCRAENLPSEIRNKITLAEWEAVQATFAMELACAVDCVARDARSQYRN
jgi:hypothetical protein